MTSGQEGKGRTKTLIHTVLFPKFGESEINFCISPPVLQSSVHVKSTIIPQKKSTSFIFHLLKGFHDRSILAKDKGHIHPFTACTPQQPAPLTVSITHSPARRTVVQNCKGRACLFRCRPKSAFFAGPRRPTSIRGPSFKMC